MPIDRTLGHRAPLLWLVLPFLAGLAAARAGAAVPVPAGLAAALLASVLAFCNPVCGARLWAAVILAAMFLAGNASYAINGRRPPGWEGSHGRQVRLSVRIDRVNPGAEEIRQATGTGTIVHAEGRSRDLEGQRIYFSIRLEPSRKPPAGSSTISASGLIAAVPRAPAPETFDGYLSGLGVNYRLTRARMIAQLEGPTAYRRFCENLALRMNALLGSGIGRKPALAAVYRAMMLGRRRGLSSGQRRLFLRGGSMHLFAINGLHIGVVAVSLNALLGLLRCPKPLAGSLVLAVLWLDVDTTGASPSAVRAFLMVGSMEAAWVFRRPGNPLAALTASALAVALIRPMDFFSASFQMSYAVVTGIIALGLPLGSRLKARFLRACDEVPRETWRLRHRATSAAAHTAAPAVAVCTAAALVSAISGVEFFGLLAPVGLLVNLVLAPLASLVIVAGFSSIVAGLSGAVAVARVFNIAAAVLLSSINSILAFATAAPGAWFPAHTRAPWVGPAALVLLVASCLFGYGSGWRRERGGFWPPFAIVALTLLAGVKFG